MTERGCVLLAFDSFKGCLSASEACQAAAEGIRARFPDAHIVSLPVSDGGEGMLEAISANLSLTSVTAFVHNPLMQPHAAVYGLSPDGGTAYIESATVIGLNLVSPAERHPLRLTSYGLGELILHAISRGARRLYIGLGGTATCDGGRGMIECLKPHLPLPAEVIGLTDVQAPLLGPDGAAYVFGPQKGATPEDLPMLDERLREFAKSTPRLSHSGTEGSLTQVPGAGAAGGIGYALMAYLHATLIPGIDFILNLLPSGGCPQPAALLITGEGRSDRQTLMGKAPYGILRHFHSHHLSSPVHLLSGAVSDADALLAAGFASATSINDGDPRPLPELLRPDVARANISRAAALLAERALAGITTVPVQQKRK